jgi:type IV secretory pathway VirJ component
MVRSARRARRNPLRSIALVIAIIAAVVGVTAWTGGFFDRDAYHLLNADGPRTNIAALYFSGDMGLRFGMGPPTTRALAEHGVPVLGVSSSTAFRTRRTRTEIDAIVADSARRALAETGARKLVLIGQSYGSDILQTGLADFPADLRAKVAAVILVVPGKTVFFRADPSNLAYRGAPDSIATTTARTITWTPLTCIYGQAEPDSLCPLLRLPNATIVAMPGGHFLGHDDASLVGHVLGALRGVIVSNRT